MALALLLDACTTAHSAAPPAASEPARSTAPSSRSSPSSPGAVCSTAHLRLAPGPAVSEATQQESRVLALTNTSAAPCHVVGYPRVVLEDRRGRPIRIRYRDGGDQMVTARRPRRVVLPPGGAAYFMFNQNACYLGFRSEARFVRVMLPGGGSSLRAAIGRSPIMGSCRAGEPAVVVDISPVEPTVQALLEASSLS